MARKKYLNLTGHPLLPRAVAQQIQDLINEHAEAKKGEGYSIKVWDEGF